MEAHLLRDLIKDKISKFRYFEDEEIINEINSTLIDYNQEFEAKNEDFKDYKFSKNTVKHSKGFTYYAYRDDNNYLYFDDSKKAFKMQYLTENLEVLFVLETVQVLYDEAYRRINTFDNSIKQVLLDKIQKEIWKLYYECVCNIIEKRLETLYFIANTQIKIIRLITKEEEKYV